MSLSFPREINLEILSYLSLRELAGCCRLNKKWKEIASDETLWGKVIARDFAFGKEWWEKNYGDVGEVPPLPKDIVQILKSPCPYRGLFWFQKWFYKETYVADTHVLVLKPKSVNGEPISSKHLTESKIPNVESKIPKGPHICATDFDISGGEKTAYWFLMTKDIVLGTLFKDIPGQEYFFEKEMGYRFAEPIEAAIGILATVSRDSSSDFNENYGTRSRGRIGNSIYFGPNKNDGLKMRSTKPERVNIAAVAVKRLDANL